MRASFSPTARAAQLLAARTAPPPPYLPPVTPTVPAVPVAAGSQCCEWPRRPASHPPFTSIRQALLAIQARHA